MAAKKAKQPEMWTCVKCGRAFANRNQSHACARHDLAHHFRGRPPSMRALYGAFAAMFESIGSVIVLPEKTRIAFQVRMSFAQLTPKQGWIDGHFVLARRAEDALWARVESFSPRNHLHAFRLTTLADIDAKLESYAREAYAVGAQQHLRRKRPS